MREYRRSTVPLLNPRLYDFGGDRWELAVTGGAAMLPTVIVVVIVMVVIIS